MLKQFLHILDLDTIEVSNLNRQFLFRKEHRGMYKAQVAKDVLLQQNPKLKIFAYNDNIKEEKFGVKFFQKFSIVFMALDNSETRQYVNKICMSLDIPLMDSGTTGFKGQAFLLKRGQTRCYDCFPKTNEKKTYPACTIRTLPDKPVHCIIWAKYLFGVLFGPQDDDSNLLQDLKNDLNDKQIGPEQQGVHIFKKIFHEDIINQISSSKEESEKFKHLKPLELEKYNYLPFKDLHNQMSLKFLQNVHSLEDYIQIFLQSFDELRKRQQEQEILIFEKDDNQTMKFISSAANLRSYIFNIPMQNEFQVKEISGNIIPAIASTNAMVAAVEVTEAIKFVAKQKLKRNNNSKEVYVQNDLENKLIQSKAQNPNPNCTICNIQLIPDIVFCNFKNIKFGEFLDKTVNPAKLESYSVMKDSDMIFEYDESMSEDEAENSKKQLDKLLIELFHNASDQNITITNEESGNLFRKYVVVHMKISQESEKSITIEEVMPESDRKPINLQKLLEQQMKDQEKKIEEQNQEKMKNIKISGNKFEIQESEDEEIMIENDPVKRKRQEDDGQKNGHNNGEINGRKQIKLD